MARTHDLFSLDTRVCSKDLIRFGIKADQRVQWTGKVTGYATVKSEDNRILQSYVVRLDDAFQGYIESDKNHTYISTIIVHPDNLEAL